MHMGVQGSRLHATLLQLLCTTVQLERQAVISTSRRAVLATAGGAAAAYASIADRFDFYGQLAAEELGRRVNVPPRPAPVTDQEIAEARANPGLRRAVQLFRLGWRAEAVPEWNYSLRGMSDRQLLAAAELARAENIYDRVVNTSDRTEKEFDFSQRFIAPFEGRVTAKANAIALDPAWVYGLIRQESRFIMDARSSVGASGLMQIMPATARWTAKKIGLAYKPEMIADRDINLRLGTAYLKLVDRTFGCLVRGTALYNLYLRALGMGVGADAIVLTGDLEATDLLAVGDQTVVGRDAQLSGVKLSPSTRPGCPLLQFAPVTLGHECTLGDGAVWST